MQRPRAAIGSAMFFVLAPGVVAGFVPWLLTRWRVSDLPAYWLPLQGAGALLLGMGIVVLFHAFGRFVMEGFGTPAPVAPTEQLVIGGVYRYVRNPMYVAVLSCIFGQAAVLGRPVLLPYGLLVGAVFVSFVRWHEEPVLARRFGLQYEHYRAAVPGWRARLRPWRPDEELR